MIFSEIDSSKITVGGFSRPEGSFKKRDGVMSEEIDGLKESLVKKEVGIKQLRESGVDWDRAMKLGKR